MENEASTAVNDSAVQDTGTTESATVENKSTGTAEETQQTDTSADESEELEQTGEESEETEQESESNESEHPKAEKRKEQLNTEIRDLVTQRNTLAQEVETLNAQYYKPATVDELIEQSNPETGDNYTRLEAQFEAMKQERDVERYNKQVADSVFTLDQEVAKVFNDFPMFDSLDKKNFNKELAAEVYEIFQESLIRDPNTNQVIGSHIKSPYKLYKSYATAAATSARQAEIQGQRNAEKMMSNVDTTTGGQGKAVKSFEQLTPSQMREQLIAKGHDF